MSNDENESPFLSEEDFAESLTRMNALCGVLRWQKTTAIKGHTDEFGVSISNGEVYYKRDLGGSFSSVLKLSRQSMDKLLYATVYSCPAVEQLADTIRKEEDASFLALRALAGNVKK